MKVVFIYRQKQSGVYSIEELFHTVAGELSKQVEVVEYVAGPRSRLLLDAWRLRKLDADIYHVTGDINYMVNFLPARKTVLTLHDIRHYLNDLKGVKRWLYKWIWLILPIQSAAAVTAVSRATSENVYRHLGVEGTPIEVISNCHAAFFKPAAKPFAKECPVILQVGTGPNKNAIRLVEALKGLRCHLILIGSLDAALRQKLDECGVAYENFVGVNHEALYEKYVECDLVAFVSLGEGFGVPIVEAQAVGRPVITADISPMREVAGSGACLVDSFDVSQIREGIQRIICDPGYRKDLVESGLHNVRRYSSHTISSQYLALYKRLALIYK
jgi:glycosyltransferase involved in cell wall biosynthesis